MTPELRFEVQPIQYKIIESCPACGEPVKNDALSHDQECPFRGDDLTPDEGNY